MLSRDFPVDYQEVHALLQEVGISSVVAFASLEGLTDWLQTINCSVFHLKLDESDDLSLLLALSDICTFIKKSIGLHQKVLVHSLTEEKAYVAILAYCECGYLSGSLF